MSISLAECEQQARQLTLKDRAVLIDHLIASLDELSEAECERLWLEEADRRYREYREGGITSRPVTEVFRDARAGLRARK